MDTTLDGILDRRVTLEQPAKGYRVAVDTVLLAAAVPAQAGENVLDLGCGVGGTMLCLARRVPDIKATGVEIQPELAALCESNIARNGFQASLNVVQGDVTGLPDNFTSTFDHVMMNPPYHEEARHDVSPDAIKRIANTEKDGDLVLWLAAAAKSLHRNGTLTLIHRADRLEDILAFLAANGFGGVRVRHILARRGEINDRRGRVVMRAFKDLDSHVVRCQPLILHKDSEFGGGYTDDADASLRHMKALDFTEE